MWISPALEAQAQLVPAPTDSATREFPLTSEVLGQALDTWEKPATFPCSALHCTLPWPGNRWVLTAYTCRELRQFEASDIAALVSLGFPLPVSASRIPAAPAVQRLPTGTTEGGVEFFLDLCCGASSPLSNAMAGSAVACIRVDILGEEPLDLSLDAVYDRLLRLAFSGCVKFAHASPPCRDYSRLSQASSWRTARHQESRTLAGSPKQQCVSAGTGQGQPAAPLPMHMHSSCSVCSRRSCISGAAHSCNVMAGAVRAVFSRGNTGRACRDPSLFSGAGHL